MVDLISKDIPDLHGIDIITLDIVLFIAYLYHNNKNDKSHNKALKSLYKGFCDDVIKRYKLPGTLVEYMRLFNEYI